MSNRILLVVGLLPVAAGCVAEAPSSPAPSRAYTPPPLLEIAQEDPVLVAYCIAEEEIIGHLTPVISDKAQGARAAQLLRTAARLADRQAVFLRSNGRPEVAPHVRDWAEGLRRGAVATRRGAGGYEALRRSLLALRRVQRDLSCEVDL